MKNQGKVIAPGQENVEAAWGIGEGIEGALRAEYQASETPRE